jgi:hypothetical protein
MDDSYRQARADIDQQTSVLRRAISGIRAQACSRPRSRHRAQFCSLPKTVKAGATWVDHIFTILTIQRYSLAHLELQTWSRNSGTDGLHRLGRLSCVYMRCTPWFLYLPQAMLAMDTVPPTLAVILGAAGRCKSTTTIWHMPKW